MLLQGGREPFGEVRTSTGYVGCSRMGGVGAC